MYNVVINTNNESHTVTVKDLDPFIESLKKGDIFWTPDRSNGLWVPMNAISSMTFTQMNEGENAHRDTQLSDVIEITQDETPHQEAV